MFLIKIPKDYSESISIEAPFKELSLAYSIETSTEVKTPCVIEGDKIHSGVIEIEKLIMELRDYYSADYNCSCAR